MSMDPSDQAKQDSHTALLNAKFNAKKKPGPKPGFMRKNDKEMWHDAMLCIMGNLQVKSPQGVQVCVPVADEYVRILNEKFK